MLFLTKFFGVTTSDAERYLDAEREYAEEIVGHVLTMQASAAAEQRRPLCRGTHAKGVCARARFGVLDVTAGGDPVLAARLARGIFGKPGTYPATVRFGNSDPQVNSDQKPDVRSLSFFVDLTRGGTKVPADGSPASGLFAAERADPSHQRRAGVPGDDEGADGCKSVERFGVTNVSRPVACCASDRIGKSPVKAAAEGISAASLLEHSPVPPRGG